METLPSTKVPLPGAAGERVGSAHGLKLRLCNLTTVCELFFATMTEQADEVERVVKSTLDNSPGEVCGHFLFVRNWIKYIFWKQTSS